MLARITGLLIGIVAPIATFLYLHFGKPPVGLMNGSIAICAFAMVFGVVLILADRITELSIGKFGTLKAAAEQALVDAGEIRSIRERIESQAATVDMVAQQAQETAKLTTDLTEQNTTLKKHAQELNELLKETQTSQKELGQVLCLHLEVVEMEVTGCEDDGIDFIDDKKYRLVEKLRTLRGKYPRRF